MQNVQIQVLALQQNPTLYTCDTQHSQYLQYVIMSCENATVGPKLLFTKPADIREGSMSFGNHMLCMFSTSHAPSFPSQSVLKCYKVKFKI